MTRNDRLMTVPEVCAELGGVSRRTFYRWRELGQAPACVQLPNHELRIWRSDLMTWLNARREGK
ncbi:helix-turn-helix domain-containing protein [Nonomuraea sp. NPDC052634]|jgi:predicted DNA-binding transcriptional regulator AlpA|uniref:helix-turn-helix transcriptional regulator n=1 Tax=unclassified Nonomuraea TaxID=2593643 RepID=UPI003444E659